MRYSFFHRIACGLSSILILLVILSVSVSQDRPQQGSTTGDDDIIRHHERLLQERARKTERTRAVRAKTATVLAEVENRLREERVPLMQSFLRVRLEDLRLLLLRRTILQQRAELKQTELTEYVNLLRKLKERSTPLTPAERNESRRAFLARRLAQAEGLLRELRNSSDTIISPRGKKAISRLVENQQALIEEIKRTISKDVDKKAEK